MQERHADPLDEAAALSHALTDAAIDEVRRANAPESHPDFDGEHCLDCDISIPAGRLALGKIRCVNCQERLEKRKRLQGRPAPAAVWADDE